MVEWDNEGGTGIRGLVVCGTKEHAAIGRHINACRVGGKT